MTLGFRRRIKFLTILLMGTGLLLPKLMQNSNSRASKTIEKYWDETGLSTKELEGLLGDQVCYLNQQNFLACVNSIATMLEKFELALNPDGTLRGIRADDVENAWNEKKEITKWGSYFNTKSRIPFLEIWKKLDAERVQPQERRAIVAMGINGFLSIFKDPHTYIIPIALYEDVIANSDAKQYTIGLIYKREGGQLLVRKIFPRAPADIAGLRKHDRIVRMNGRQVSHMLPSDVNEAFKMQNVNRLDLLLLRDGVEKRVEIVKAQSFFPNVISRSLVEYKDLGLITIHRFAKGVCEQTRAELKSLRENAMRGLILDLRDNPGGQVDEAACVINLFVPRGRLLFETRYINPTQSPDRYISERDPVYLGPISILINSGSASAAEIVAGALKDAGRATLVGERSFGKGTFQDGRIWAANSKIALFQTEGFYYFPSGWTPQLVGLQPDLKIEFGREDFSREADQYFNPVMPPDMWAGPQTISWLLERQCDFDKPGNPIAEVGSEQDPQVRKAGAWLKCGEAHDRNGSL